MKLQCCSTQSPKAGTGKRTQRSSSCHRIVLLGLTTLLDQPAVFQRGIVVRLSASQEVLAIALHDLPDGMKEVDLAEEPTLRTQEPVAIRGRHPLQPAFKLSEVVSRNPPNRESLSRLTNDGTPMSKPI